MPEPSRAPQHPAEQRAQAIADWDRIGRSLQWEQDFEAAYAAEGVDGEWFPGGRLNATSNCLDRHLATRGDRVAVYWEGEPGDRRALTYRDLHAEVIAFAEALQGLGVTSGERVVVYLGWIPESVVAMLACARLGAVHVVVPVPLPPDAVADRLADVSPRVLVTQDGAWRHGMILPLKARADEALAAVDGIEQTVVVRRTGLDVTWYEGDRWYHELVASPRRSQPRDETLAMRRGRSEPAPNRRRDVPAAAVAADHPLMVAHLSDRRGRPKAIVHRTGGLLACATAVHRLALTSTEHDVLWCAVDLGWSAAQIHGVYGPLLCGATAVMFEGMLDTPTHQRAWEIVERYGVTSLMTTPSVWRTLRGWTDSPPGDRAASLRYLVTAGEHTDGETRRWLEDDVGRGRATVADAWGQTELGGAVLYRPPLGTGLPELGLDVVDAEGRSLPAERSGELVVRHPWPGLMLKVGSGDASADGAALYWHHAGVYATNDLAQRRADGEIVVLGRIDPVISVSGQLVSATEVRDVLVEHPLVDAAEVVERTDSAGRQALVACVVVTGEAPAGDGLADDLRASVREVLGGLAQPKVVAFCEDLPAEAPRPLLRRALWRLCVGTTADRLAISSEQLAAALRTEEQAMA